VNAVPAQPPWIPTTRQVAIGGIVLGLFAFWLTIPPLSARSPWWPVLVGLCAIAAGIWAVTRGVRRPGWGAVAAGLVVVLTAFVYVERRLIGQAEPTTL
jgi:thiol:disulfide interchange protein